MAAEENIMSYIYGAICSVYKIKIIDLMKKINHCFATDPKQYG
jgi:hypothetical protein